MLISDNPKNLGCFSTINCPVYLHILGSSSSCKVLPPVPFGPEDMFFNTIINFLNISVINKSNFGQTEFDRLSVALVLVFLN